MNKAHFPSRRHQRFLNDELRRLASTGHDPTTALTLDALNRAAYTKADNHLNHPQIMKPEPAKNLPDPPSEGLRPLIVPVGIRGRHDGNGY